jgi:simple sugar transport system ATP-binding protein
MTEGGLSIIFITHKLREVMDVANRITVLRKGKYVDTVENKDISKKDLARMMVGRDVVFRVDRKSIQRGNKVLEISDLWAKSSRDQMAVKGIDVEVYNSEILGLAGVAGNGQKEMFEVLIGARTAEKGSIRLNGVKITNLSPKDTMKAGLAHIPQDRIREGLVPDFSISENLILGKQRKKRYRTGVLLDYRAINSYGRDLISLFNIDTPSELHKTSLLSGGNLQRVILARELEQNPVCLIANQPTRGLDVGAIEQVHIKLLEQRQAGVGILLFSEDLEEIFILSDRIAVIYEGKIAEIFNTDEVDYQTIGLLMAGVDDSIK